jgi:hypothetical protein
MRALRRGWLCAGVVALLPVGCSLLAPPDSELVGRRPEGEAGGGSGGGSTTAGSATMAGEPAALGGNGQAGAGEEDVGGNSPGRPVDVGTPTGDWEPGPGLKTRFAADVEPANAHRDYPRPTLTRHAWATLNGLWDFAIDSSADQPPEFGDAKLLVPFPLEAALSGVAGGLLNADEFLWYRRSFDVPKAWRGKRLLLHFGAVDWDASVRVNGVEVVSHQGGYDAFSVDITDQLAEADAQELLVRVADPTDSGSQPRGKQALVPGAGTSLTSVSGIWQSVWLEPVPALSIQSVGFSGDPKTGVVHVTPELSGAGTGATLRAIVRDGSRELARAEAADGAAFDVTVPSPEPWTPDSPRLYDVTLELEQAGAVIDSADSYFGLRTASLAQDAAVTKLAWNGEPLAGIGVIYQGYWPEGLFTPPTDVALKADLTLAKSLGFNTIRVHQKLESERFYYWADQLGLVVWQDVPAGDNSTEAGRTAFGAELSAMVAERSFHPSLGVWTLFTADLGQTGADVGKLVARVKTLSGAQLVIGAAGVGDDGSGDLRDRPDNAFITCPAPDERAVALGQFGSLTRAISGHTWSGSGAGVQTAADTERYVGLARRARGAMQRPGLSAAIFRQLTDVENELDGLVTYDRQITKVTAKTVAEANSDLSSPIVPLVQASEFEVKPAYAKDAQLFRYTTNAPAPAWPNGNFDDKNWAESAFGIGDTPDKGARIRTPLTFNEVWARTTFTLAAKPVGRLLVRLMYDEDTQVFLNGSLIADLNGYVQGYGDFLASDAAAAALVAGKNTLAVHTFNTNGGRYIDVGLWLTDDAPPYRAADEPTATTAGLSYSDYDLTLTGMPADLTVNAPRAQGTATTPTNYTPALDADNTRALNMHGYLEVAEDGVYTFSVDTDDGARVRIGKDRVIEALRNDGTGITKRSGNVALAKGKHEITIDYFANDSNGANSFNVTWAGPGFGATGIPAGNLSH